MASEVKALVNQTAKATDDIQAKVLEIQQFTGSTVTAVQGIGSTITSVSDSDRVRGRQPCRNGACRS